MAIKFIPPVRRVQRGKYHIYEDGDGHRMPGVTTIIGDGIPKQDVLTAWASRVTAEAAVNRWDELATLPIGERLEALKQARWETTNKAKNKGTAVHRYAAAIVAGDPVQIKADEQHLRPYVENYAQFIDTWELDPILIETVVVNYSAGYAGTLDLVAELTTPSGDREIWLLDAKTGEKGIFPETAIQLAAYRYAEFYVDNDGNEQPMIPVYGTGAIHITSDDAVLIPTVSERDEYKTFRAAQHIYGKYKQIEDGLILPAMLHPTRSTARIVWGDD